MAEFPAGADLADYIPGLVTAELISTGGQKGVYKAEIEGQIVALKLIALEPPDADDDVNSEMSEPAQRARREFDILDDVDIPVLTKRGPLGLNSISLDANSWLYFTEEWIDGKTLREIIHEGKLTDQEAVALGVDLIQAVHWLSGRGLVHRDIKPENIMFRDALSRWVLLDPGIALDLQGPSLTLVQGPVGTTAYLSPEQMDPLKKRDLDFRSDLFAVGVVMYEAATGEHPFRTQSSTVPEVLSGILYHDPAPVSESVGGFSSDLSAFIVRLLGKLPHQRFRRCEHALSVLSEIGESLGGTE